MDVAATNHKHFPVFVVGTWHSGTYLLVHLLSRHSRIIALPGESHYVIRRAGMAKRIAALPETERWRSFMLSMLQNTWGRIDQAAEIALERRLVATVPFDVEDLDSMLSTMMHGLCDSLDKDIWVEKSPTHVAYLEELKSGFPHARVVHIVRDPKAVMASTKLRSIVPGAKHKVCDIFHPVHEAFTWREAVRRGDAFGTQHPDSYLEIGFEDLVQRSEQTARRLCEFLDLDFEHGILNVEQVNPALRSEFRRQGFDRRPLRRWEKALAVEELYLLSKICGRETLRRGYDAPHTRLPVVGLARQTLRMFSFVTRKLTRALLSSREVGIPILLGRLKRKYGAALGTRVRILQRDGERRENG